MKKVIGIVGHGISAMIMERFAQSYPDIEIVQVTENARNIFEPEPIPYIKIPEMENKINYDKYGKLLTNKGSKFHK